MSKEVTLLFLADPQFPGSVVSVGRVKRKVTEVFPFMTFPRPRKRDGQGPGMGFKGKVHGEVQAKRTLDLG